jgi:two-component system NtrC family sensor kinase
MGYAEIMINEKNPKQIKKYAKKIVAEANKASEIISWITRYTHEAKDSDISEVNIQEIINESLDAVRHTRRSGDIHIIKEFPRVPNIRGNRTELQQVFVNLFDNAVDAMGSGGVLDVSTHLRDGCLEILVSDSGAGISTENIKHIFDPFFTTKEGIRGTGLGLFVTSMMVKKHNGVISVASRVGKGTTFTVRLPILDELGEGKEINEEKETQEE